MVKLNKSKKGAEMPLNTIVIALLVIIVMVVIITFFVSKMGGAGQDLDDSSGQFSDCSIDNPALNAFGYTNVDPLGEGQTKCSEVGEGYKAVPGIKGCCAK